MPRSRRKHAQLHGRTRNDDEEERRAAWARPFEYAKDDDYDPHAEARAALAARIERFTRVDADKESARRRIEWTLGERWESACWNAWRAERGLDPLPDPVPLFYAWEVAFAGYTEAQAPGGLWGDEAG